MFSTWLPRVLCLFSVLWVRLGLCLFSVLDSMGKPGVLRPVQCWTPWSFVLNFSVGLPGVLCLFQCWTPWSFVLNFSVGLHR